MASTDAMHVRYDGMLFDPGTMLQQHMTATQLAMLGSHVLL